MSPLCTSAMISLKFLYSNPLGALITGRKNRKCSHPHEDAVPAEKDPCLELDPVRSRYVLSIPRAQWFHGVLLQGYLVPPQVLRGLEDFKIRPDDVFVITYPKSGTTWTEEIVSLIYNDGDTEKVKNKLLAYRVQHLEVGPPVGHLWHLRKTKSPRLMATHLPLHVIPRQLQQARCKIIYVVRNPKDNAVSYYHHHKMSTFLGNYKGSWEEFLTHYMEGHVVYGSWFNHVLPYWRFHLERPDKVLFISFEELKIDLPGMVSRICNFLGKTLSPDAIEAISRHCSFEQMKNNNMVNREVLPISDLFDMSQSKFMRKGIIGDWKNYFTPEQNKKFDELYEARMAGSGLDLVFEPQEAFLRMKKYGRIILPPGLVSGNWTSASADNICDVASKEGEGNGKAPRQADGLSEEFKKKSDQYGSCPCVYTPPPPPQQRPRDVPLHPFMTPDPLTLTG